MAEGVNVQTLEVLRDLEAALRRFAGEAQESLLAVEGEIQRTRDWLSDRVAHWRHEVERWEQRIEEADEDDDLGHARLQLEAAQQELATAKRWACRFENVVTEYQRQTQRCRNLAVEHASKGCAFLHRRSRELDVYVARGVSARPDIRNATPSPMQPNAHRSGSERVGRPEADARFSHIQQANDCLIVAIEGVIRKWAGVGVNEVSLALEAWEMGLYNPGPDPSNPDLDRKYDHTGTTWDIAPRLLERYGLDAELKSRMTLDDLRTEISKDHAVIVWVDAGILWQCPEQPGGHAVWVTGLDLGSRKVYLNDSGNPDIGTGGHVSVDVFEAAWSANDRQGIVVRGRKK